MTVGMENIKWLKLRSIEVSCEEKTFLKAIEIWLLKPHVVNRRLVGAALLHRTRTDSAGLKRLFKQLLSTAGSAGRQLSNEVSAKTVRTCKQDNSNLFQDQENHEIEQGATASCGDDGLHLSDGTSRFELSVRKLVPRSTGHGINSEDSLNEIVVIDLDENTATFVLLQSTSDVENHSRNSRFQTAYRLSFSSEASRISLHVSKNYQEPQSPSLAITCPTKAWLQDCLLPKIAKWASEVSANAPVRNSQALVSMERYSALYGDLKKKYGAKFVQIWPENTDPLKFVYEDVAIATYLIVLWEQERAEEGLEKFQSFVDLGCGNGLLVHILNSEGYPGKGIDLRRRKIWDLYGPETNLEECSITPSNDYLFPDCDWLIGNHSDELTPWIPVMAARSSYSTRYFVLPCCFHDFDVKFMRCDQTKTQYRAYLDFVEEVGRVCGFMVQEDTMRIPSTKKICQIGSHRNYQPEQAQEIQEQITDYIASRRPQETSPASDMEPKLNQGHSLLASERITGADDAADGISTCQVQSTGQTCSDQTSFQGGDRTSSATSSVQWAPHFQARKRNDPVRNCSKLDYDLKQMIVNEVAHAILTEERSIFSDSRRGKKEKKLWRRGGSLTFAEIVKLFDSNTLKQLKSECGGLKTLLKNSHQVFQVSSNKVEIRNWSEQTPTKQTHSKRPVRRNIPTAQTFKTRLCWFHDHHPDGCPRLADDCQFAHGVAELRKLSLPTRENAICV